MSLDLPGNDDGKPTVSATIDKVTSGNGSHSYTLKDLKFSGASGNYVMSEVTGLIGYIGGLGEEQGTAVLNALSPTVTIPDGASKGEPNGTGRSPARSWDWAWASQPTSRMMAH